ncbi:(deoxy)nucleoside triphosphate pyrophosphohydrolase [Sphingomonas jaspsi]|uniref:(deoxy)nucleoside triphosphate pyrophosphohydrolase n=1 Tax=Sphingomonas jaspsi TaxID=392409 RepID=UPI00055F9ABB|nr:NUDIX domain-containing protein [Sphingomonas jaspsi]
MKQVAAAIVVHNNRILVARRGPGQSLEGLWEFPGGKLEECESPQQCVIREIEEELSLEIQAGEILCESVHHYPGGAINLIAVLATTGSRKLEMTVHDGIQWLSPAELLTVDLAPADIPIALRLAERFSYDDGVNA